ncbi:MAG: transporter [Bacteroidota bacterium]
MRYYLKLIPLLLCFQIGFAQYTKVINSKRPGFSDSPYSLGTGVYQIEGGLFYKNIGNYLYWDTTIDHAVNYNAKAFGTDITFRTTQFFERLEFNVDLTLQNENRNYTIPSVYSESGFGLSRLTVGAKYLVFMPTYTDKSKEIHSWVARHAFDKKRLIPAVGVYAGLNTNLLNSLYKNPDGISPRLAIYTQNDLSNKLIVITNFIMDKAFTNQAENSFIMTATYSLNEQFSLFGEGQVFFRKNVPNDFQFGTGGAYLINKNMQVDLSARMIYDERGDDTFLFGSGVSWRIDKHKDKIIRKKVDNNEVRLEQEKKGFFNTITFGLFSGKKSKPKKNEKMRKVKTPKVKKRSLEPPVNKKAQKAKKKRNKQLIKQQKRKEKAEKKYYKKQKKAEDKS